MKLEIKREQYLTFIRKALSILLNYVVAFIIAISLTWIIISLLGKDPVLALTSFFQKSIGDFTAIAESFTYATPIILTGVALCLAFTAKFWNIGAEGQLYLGALASFGAAFWVVRDLHPILAIPTIILAGLIGGGIWGAIAGFLKVKFEVNEVLSTLMLNFIALAFASYLINGPWDDPTDLNRQTYPIPDQFKFPNIIPGTGLHAGLFLALLSAPAMYFIINKSVMGFKVRILGSSMQAAKYSGLKLSLEIVKLAFLSGTVAGLAGVTEVFGVNYVVRIGISLFYGYLGVIAAFLAKNNPLAVLGSGFFIGMLINGGFAMQSSTGVPAAVSNFFVGTVLVSTIGLEQLRGRIKLGL